MKRRLQSLSIWPVSPSPVKGNRLAEQRHYIIICRCRRARQKREGTHGTLGERKGLWHPSLSHLGWHSTMGEKYTHTHTHRLWPCCSGGAKTREARENRKVEEKWDLSLPSFFSPSHFRLKKKKDSLKEKMYFVASGMAKKRGRKRTCLEWEQGVCLWWLNASVDEGEASGLARAVCYRGSPGPRGAEPGGGWRARALARGEMRGQWAGEGFTFHMKNLISPKNIQHIAISCLECN